MKKYLWFLGAFLVIVALGFFMSKRSDDKVLGTQSDNTPLATSVYSNLISFNFKENSLNAAWYKVSDPFNLKLIANFDEKENASDVFEAKSCKFLSNAGFYMKDARPAGYFSSEGLALRGFSENILFDGVLSVNYLGTPRILRGSPDETTRIGVQTGPIIKENNEFKTLNITTDKQSRRMVAAVTGTNELYFIVFYEGSSAYLGPNLDDMPEVLKTFEEKSGITFADAINLDGGSASAFYTNGFSLSEISPVGAFFCEK